MMQQTAQPVHGQQKSHETILLFHAEITMVVAQQICHQQAWIQISVPSPQKCIVHRHSHDTC